MAMEGVKAWTFVPPAAEAAAPNPVPPKCDYTEGVGLEGARMMESFLLPADIADHMCCDRAFYGQGHGVSLTCSSESGGSAEVAAQCNCTVFAEVTGSSRQAGARSSKVVPPARGQCLLFEEVSGTEPAKGSASGGAVSPVPPKMWPSWPASSPWVTAVGATRFVQQDVSAPEMATDQFGSGGGFSDMWPAFRSQAAVVEEYLRTAPGLPPSGSFPPGGRATPDVSALGEGYQVMIGGHVEPIGGTSASAPMFAALVSLLNEAS
ncbi:unnamed protein product [Prorocentrum cordatum]|uniref:subtilisin n=1 Tax=Prorocentrum cordatum TaxID=2364126 RepID=A0ABN9WQD0_9DINO|nr:unnamed protein product [Polarella glacialis]